MRHAGGEKVGFAIRLSPHNPACTAAPHQEKLANTSGLQWTRDLIGLPTSFFFRSFFSFFCLLVYFDFLFFGIFCLFFFFEREYEVGWIGMWKGS